MIVKEQVAFANSFGKPNALLKTFSNWSGTVGQTAGYMSCKDTIHLICWYLERKLSPSVEDEIERHLSSCRNCHLVFDAANTTLDRYFGPARQVDAEAAPTAA